MPKKYPPLDFKEVLAILKANSFYLDNVVGSHQKYKKKTDKHSWSVTVDNGKAPFNEFHIKSMIDNSGLTREQFYNSTKETAKKIK